MHSSAGEDADPDDDVNQDVLSDGLGAAANGRGQLNPMIVVQGRVFTIENGDPAEVDSINFTELLNGLTGLNATGKVMYPGSTTGQSFDNEICSPYIITWHVDLSCNVISAETFDNLCKEMKEVYNKSSDLKAKGSRKLVAREYVVNSTYVVPLA